MAEEFTSGYYREVKVGYSEISHGKAKIPKNAKVIGYYSCTVIMGVPAEYVVYVIEDE